MSFNSRTAVTADYNDGWLRVNNENEFGNGVYSPEKFRGDSGMYVSGSRYIDDNLGNYGTIRCGGNGAGNWEGFSIDGRSVWMHDGGNASGLYNDVNNEWMVYMQYNSYVQLRHNNSTRLETSNNGVSINNIMTCNSDKRLKENVTNLDGSLDKVLKMRGVSFNWINEKDDRDDGEKTIGFLAQEMQEIEPSLVYNSNTGADGTQYLGVAYQNLSAHLVEAIKEQNEVINNLRARIEVLEKHNGIE